MIQQADILREFKLFFGGTGGIDSWLRADTSQDVFERLGALDKIPLSRVQLTQLLVLSHEAGPSDGFFEYYWLSTPPDHPYDVTTIPGYEPNWIGLPTIKSLQHLKWGLYRLYVDALLYFGSIRSAYRALREHSLDRLTAFFRWKRFDTQLIRARGPALDLAPIAKDNRYLISEMACKSYGATADNASELKKVLLAAFKEHKQAGGGKVKIGDLLDGTHVRDFFADQKDQLLFSADELLTEDVETTEQLDAKYARIADSFTKAREAALKNTRYYLSMVGDLDVYVATSMRDRADFR